MSKSKFTPGEWFFYQDDDSNPPRYYVRVLDPTVPMIAMIPKEADASLMVSAPKLYKELKRHCDEHLASGGCPGRKCYRCSTRKALKLARGRQ